MTTSSSNSGASSVLGLAPGDKLDKYEIVEQIGAGGMSVVWKAVDRVLDRTVAIKQLGADAVRLSNDEAREQFRREARIQKRVSESQANLVRILDFIEEPRGLFIVMEFIAGQTLEQVLNANPGPMDVRQALGIVGATAMALDVMHQQNVIHRDLKPANIMLPAEGGLKLGDFGLSTLVEDQEALAAGSVRYMSPELSRAEPTDARADIYSLGMLAYEMLAGRAKFEEAFRLVLRDQRNQSLRWMKWHTNPRAKAVDLSTLNPAVSPTLAQLVSRMMEKDPALRVGSASELLAAIRRHFAAGHAAETTGEGSASAAAAATTDTAASAAPIAPDQPTAALPKASRLPQILAGVLVVQLLIIAGIFLAVRHRESTAHQRVERAALNEFNAARAEYDAGRFSEASSGFESLRPHWPGHRRFDIAAQAMSQLAQARLAFNSRQYEKAIELFREAIAHNVLPDDYRVDAERLIREAENASAFGREIQQIESLLANRSFDLARSRLAQQRRLSMTPGEEQRLNELSARIEDQARQKQIDDRIAEARAMVNRGAVAEAISHLREAQLQFPNHQIDRELESLSQTVSYGEAIRQAEAFVNQGRLADAIRLFEQAQAIREDEAVAGRIRQYRAQIAFARGEEAERAGNLVSAREFYTTALGHQDTPSAREALNRLRTADQKTEFVAAAERALTTEDYESAINHYENALKLGPDPALRTALQRVRVQQLTRTADRLLRDDKLDEARRQYHLAQELAPEDEAVQKGLAEITRRETYNRHMAQGDRLRAQSRWVDAKREFNQAQKISDTPDVRSRLDEIEYDHLLAQARTFMQSYNWMSARALLRSAARLRDTPEVRKMIEEVNKHAPVPESTTN